MNYKQFKYLNKNILEEINSLNTRDEKISFVQKLSDNFAVNNYETWEGLEDLPRGAGRNTFKYREYEKGEQYRYRKELMLAIDCDTENKVFNCWHGFQDCGGSISFQIDKYGNIVTTSDSNLVIHHMNYDKIPVKVKSDPGRTFVIRESIGTDIVICCRICHEKFKGKGKKPNEGNEQAMLADKNQEIFTGYSEINPIENKETVMKKYKTGITRERKAVKKENVVNVPVAIETITHKLKEITFWIILEKLLRERDFVTAKSFINQNYPDKDISVVFQRVLDRNQKNLDNKDNPYSSVDGSDWILSSLLGFNFADFRRTCGIVRREKSRDDVFITINSLRSFAGKSKINIDNVSRKNEDIEKKILKFIKQNGQTTIDEIKENYEDPKSFSIFHCIKTFFGKFLNIKVR